MKTTIRIAWVGSGLLLALSPGQTFGACTNVVPDEGQNYMTVIGKEIEKEGSTGNRV